MMLDNRRDYFRYYAELVGVAGATTIEYACPAGCTARLIVAVGYHDHAGALNCQWRLSMGSLHEVNTAESVVANARSSFYLQSGIPENLILNSGEALQFVVTGIAGGEHAIMLIVAEIRKGETAWS